MSIDTGAIMNKLLGITSEEIDLANQRLVYGGGKPSTILKSGKGTIVLDIDNKEYIDCNAQAFTLPMGYCQEGIVSAAYEQLRTLNHVRGGFHTIARLKLINKLADIAPAGLSGVALYPSGSLAVEGALKLAMINRPSASKFITLWDGYHGRSLATMASSYPMPETRFGPFMSNFVRVPNPYCYRCYFERYDPSRCNLLCAKMLEYTIEKAVDGPVAAVLIEPCQGNGGQIDCPQRYLRQIREICDKHDILLIFDEIQTGFGRTGSMFAADHYGVVPDIMVLGKALGGGLPLAGLLVKDTLKGFGPYEDSYTFAANPVSCATALANISLILDHNLPEMARTTGQYITTWLKKLQNRNASRIRIGDIRGPGLFIGIELVYDKDTKEPARIEANQLVKMAFEKGVIFGTSRFGDLGNVVKIKPPLNISHSEIDRALGIFEEVLFQL